MHLAISGYEQGHDDTAVIASSCTTLPNDPRSNNENQQCRPKKCIFLIPADTAGVRLQQATAGRLCRACAFAAMGQVKSKDRTPPTQWPTGCFTSSRPTQRAAGASPQRHGPWGNGKQTQVWWKSCQTSSRKAVQPHGRPGRLLKCWKGIRQQFRQPPHIPNFIPRNAPWTPDHIREKFRMLHTS